MSHAAAQRVLIALFPGCELLDFAGPAQAFYDATTVGPRAYEIVYCSTSPATSLRVAQGLTVSALEPLPEARADDWVLIPGYALDSEQRPPRSLVPWLRRAHGNGARILSVCTGAFLLGEAGLLDGRSCTTHWRRVADLEQRFPAARVLGDRLFVEDGTIVTSGGIASGIDMTLALIEQADGPAVASAVARTMVVYLRRDGSHRQESVYLDYQSHLNPSVHYVQQYVLHHPGTRESLEELAERFNMSGRNLSRLFRRSTGISVHEYRTGIRLEYARALMRNPSITLEAVAERCGFADARQLRRMFVQHFGESPSRMRESVG